MSPIWLLYLKPLKNYKRKNIHFQNQENIKDSRMQKLQTALNQHISASRAASTFFKKNKIIYMKKSRRCTHYGFCGFVHLEIADININ